LYYVNSGGRRKTCEGGGDGGISAADCWRGAGDVSSGESKNSGVAGG